jgi:hypothetical protein
MSRVSAFLFAVLVVGSVLGGVVAGGAGASSDAKPSVSVTVNGEPVADGGRAETGIELDIAVSGSVGEDAPEGTELSEVVVRVEGEFRASVDVNGTSVEETFSPNLAHGNNTVRVIVTDDAGAVNSTMFTVDRDEQRPYVYLTSPYETRPYYRISDGTTTGSDTTLSGWIVEDSTSRNSGSHTTTGTARATRTSGVTSVRTSRSPWNWGIPSPTRRTGSSSRRSTSSTTSADRPSR